MDISNVSSDTGLQYYRARYYDPQLGRFIAEDPMRLWGGIDFYSYVSNSPTGFSDPLGFQQTPKPAQPKPTSTWWNDLKGIAKECWHNPTGCGGKPGAVSVGPAPFNLCNAGDISLSHGSAPDNPYSQKNSNYDWKAQFNQDCAAKSTPGKSTYVICSSEPISYGGTTEFCHCCQDQGCKNKEKNKESSTGKK